MTHGRDALARSSALALLAALLMLSACAGPRAVEVREAPADAATASPATGSERAARPAVDGAPADDSSSLVRGSDLSEADAALAPALGAVPVSVEPWNFAGRVASVLLTPSYRIHTTVTSREAIHRLPRFMEAAMHQYRTALGALPAPPEPLDIFLFARRAEWQDHTRALLQDQAEIYLTLGRGGYTTQGAAVLYDIGERDTLSILAHEGWHQYTQMTFRNALPIWLEEGIATYMEGRRHEGDRVVFDPRANPQRLRVLRRALARGDLIGLAELCNTTPQEFLERHADDQQPLLTYYAQVWALVHFLVEGDGGRYRGPLRALMQDAVDGRIAARILNSSVGSPGARQRMVRRLLGPGVLLVYFNRDLDEFERAYLAHLRAIARGEIPGFER